ncbi:MAG: hypothetical protein HFE81_06825 [Bacilli bacterium]|nr:hypothetical protein [Bacilli bacterium]
MKKVLFMCLSCILFLCGCNNQKANFKYTNEEQIKKEITTNLEQIAEETDMTSSNPFDYTKNEYYNNIVNLGEDAVPILEDMYNKKELAGVNAYLSALAIQDITKCNLHEEYNLDWSTAEKFYTLWKDNNCSFKK